jgi:hypothetical protein
MPKTIPVSEYAKQLIEAEHEASPTKSARKLAKEFGLHHKTISRILRNYDSKQIVDGIQADCNQTPAIPASNPISRPRSNEEESELLHFKVKARSLEKNLKDLLEERGKYKSLIDDLKTAIVAWDPYDKVLVSAHPPTSSPVAAVLKLSDWQIGEVIQASETEGFGEFNFAIAEQRVAKLVRSFLGWVEMHRKAGYNLQTLHVFSEGDLVSGNIHYELEITNEFPVTMAAVKGGMLMAWVVSQLAPHFETVDLWEMSADNHGRLTRKNQAKQGGVNNYSYVGHVVCNEVLKKHDNVVAHLAEGTKMLADVLGKKFLISHGHSVNAFMGIPFYGMERDRAREATKRMNTDKTFDYVSIGHWHVPNIVSGNILVNGCLTGTTEFDHMQGRHAPPSQVSFIVHPNHGLFDWTAWKLA